MRASPILLLFLLLPGCIVIREIKPSEDVALLRSVTGARPAASAPAPARGRPRTSYSIRAEGLLVIETTEEVAVPRIGLTSRSATVAERNAAGLSTASGLRVLTVERDGPASRAGIEPGDVLTSLDGTDLYSGDQLRDLLRRTDPSKPVPLLARRKGNELAIHVTLETRPENRRRTEYRTLDHGRESEAFGLEASTVPEDLAAVLFERPGPAVLLSDVPLGSPAYRAGLRQGDLVTALDGAEVRSAEDLLARLRTSSTREVRLSVVQGVRTLEATVRGRPGFGRSVVVHFPLVVGWRSAPTRSSFELIEGLLLGYDHRELPAPRREERGRTEFSMVLNLISVETTEESTSVRLLWFIRFGTSGT